jgi:hypothetical protein
VFRGGRVEIIPNERGNRKTPSCVGFYVDELLYVSQKFLSHWNLYLTGSRIGDSGKESFESFLSNPNNKASWFDFYGDGLMYVSQTFFLTGTPIQLVLGLAMDHLGRFFRILLITWFLTRNFSLATHLTN